MSLTAISLFESVRAKSFMNSTHNMCKNLESKAFGLSRPKRVIQQVARWNWREKNFS